MTIEAEDWRALARSAPWLWRTLRCVVTPAPGDDFELFTEPVRVWTGRWGGLRVATLDSTVHKVERARDGRGGGTSFVLLAETAEPPGEAGEPDGSLADLAELAHRALLADGWPPGVPGDVFERLEARRRAEAERLRRERVEAVERRSDGLVVRRHDGHGDLDVGLISSYRWVAVMDPRELADGQVWDDPDGEPGDEVDDGDLPGCEVEDVRVLQRAGREVWAATVTPTKAYDPRCSCCPMLSGRASAELMVRTGEREEPDPDGATRFEVWLDRATGVVVRLRALDGRDAGQGFDLEVEAVDEPLP